MILTEAQQALLDDLKAGVARTESFMAELTDYHGDAVTTEYLLTVHMAEALLRRGHADVAVEYRVNRIKGHVLIRDSQKEFTLGNRRFDIAVVDVIAPVFVVEVKIGVRGLSGELLKDLRKVMAYLEYLKGCYAKKVLGACVFQTHVTARKSRCVPETTRRIHKLEQKVRDGLKNLAAAYCRFEFDWMAFQEPNERIHDDEETTDVDGSPMLGRLGHATRYHAILVRRLP